MAKPRFKPRIKVSPKQAAGAVIVLVALYLLYSFLQPGVVVVTSQKTLSFSTNGTQLVKIYNGSTVAIRLISSSNSSATFYVTRTPILYGPVVVVSLYSGMAANVSSDGSQLADMNIRLDSSNGQSASIMLAPLLSSFGIRTSSSVHLLNPTGFGAGGVNVIIITTSTVTTSIPTTTVNSSSFTLFQHARNLMNQTTIGSLMNKYKTLYMKDINCTASTYNSTYYTYYSMLPPAPLSFENVSVQTPRDITVSESNTTKVNNVLVTYSAVSSSSSGSVVLALVNVSSSLFLRNVSYVGIYQGLNYTILNNSYIFQSGIRNSCGALVTPP